MSRSRKRKSVNNCYYCGNQQHQQWSNKVEICKDCVKIYGRKGVLPHQSCFADKIQQFPNDDTSPMWDNVVRALEEDR